MEKVAADAGERPGEHQDDVGRKHELHAFDEAAHEVRDGQMGTQWKTLVLSTGSGSQDIGYGLSLIHI